MIIIAALVGISCISIFLVYTSFQSTQSRLDVAATQELRKSMTEHANEIALDAESNLQTITTRMETVASNPLLLKGTSEDLKSLFSGITFGKEYQISRINYLDKDGILLYTTDSQLLTPVTQSSDLSNLQYFRLVKEKEQPIISDTFKGPDGKASIALAVPIFNSSSGNFQGALAAIIQMDSIVKKGQEELRYVPNAQAFMISTKNSTIIDYQNQSAEVMHAADLLITSHDESVAKNLQFLLEGSSGVFELGSSNSNNRIMYAYSPVVFSNTHPWSVVAISPITQSAAFSSIIEDQRLFTLTAIILIAVIAAIFMIFILTLNGRLKKIVVTQDTQIKNQLQSLQSTYEKLKEQDKIKDEFINIAAHELRTPILPIVLSAEGLAEDLGDNNNKVEIILRNAKRINKLTNDILDVSRIESNTFKLQKDKINIKKLIEESIQDILFKIADKKDSELKIVFQSELADGKEEIMADKGRLNQVLSNLLDNAVNFTTQGTITITLRQSTKMPGFVEIAIADTGKGIDPAVRERLFGKFVTKSDKAKGTGLGLYLCKAIVEAHGGKIWAEDNASEGKGTVFIFALPARGD